MLQSAFLKPNIVGTTATGLSLSRLTITIMDSKVVKESLVVFKALFEKDCVTFVLQLFWQMRLKLPVACLCSLGLWARKKSVDASRMFSVC